MSSAFVFIESNTTGTGHLCVHRARQRGFRVVFLTSRPELYPFLPAELIAPHVLDTTDVDAICAVLAEEGDLAGVMSTSEHSIETAARVAARLSLAGPDPEAVRRCRHKDVFADMLVRAGVSAPKTIKAMSVSSLEELAPELAFPVVVKPVCGSGSVGVRLVSDESELMGAGRQLLRDGHNERGLPAAPGILVQEYVRGDEYSVEVFSVDGGHQILGCTKKHLGKAPFFVETGHDFPARLAASVEQRLRSEVLRALDAVRYRCGPSHVEARIGRNGRPFVIEVNARLAGGMIPRAIEMATGIDLLGGLVDFHAGRGVNLMPIRNGRASIRFFIAERAGTVEALHPPRVHGVDTVFVPLAAVGAHVEPRGDFRDRLACVIAASEHDTRLKRAIASLRGQRVVQMRSDDEHSPGGIRKTLRAEALGIVCKAPSAGEQVARLDRLAAIDEAHLAMLVEAGVLDVNDVAPVLAEIATLRADRYSDIAGRIAPRGIYLLYEQLLIDRLGERVGGVVHTARSRNDLNACVFKLEMRELLTMTFHSLWSLRAALLAKVATTSDVLLPVYSQFQPGQPGTLAYYLWSVETALRRDQQALLNLFDDLQVCPMGAGAGAGTDFPIRPEITAELLGFSASHRSALDAVASRDLALRLLGAWAVCSTALSRLAQDLQLWTMSDVGFVELPDDLTGGSSMMPQKKNPYLLELVKGKLVSLPSTLGFALHAMQKTPFSNSVEVGTEGVSGCAHAALAFAESCDLLRLMIDALVPQPGKGEEASRNGAVIATQVANAVVRDRKVSFREAHRSVGVRLAEALESGGDPLQALQEMTQAPVNDLRAAALALRYGGGPGSVAQQFTDSQAELRRDSDVFFDRVRRWTDADRRRAVVVAALMAEGGRA